MKLPKFPSPCGDELFQDTTITRAMRISRFRPLAGMNCFVIIRREIDD